MARQRTRISVSKPNTIITRADMSVIFELLANGSTINQAARATGYDFKAVQRGVYIAELLGFEGCAK